MSVFNNLTMRKRVGISPETMRKRGDEKAKPFSQLKTLFPGFFAPFSHTHTHTLTHTNTTTYREYTGLIPHTPKGRNIDVLIIKDLFSSFKKKREAGYKLEAVGGFAPKPPTFNAFGQRWKYRKQSDQEQPGKGEIVAIDIPFRRTYSRITPAGDRATQTCDLSTGRRAEMSGSATAIGFLKLNGSCGSRWHHSGNLRQSRAGSSGSALFVFLPDPSLPKSVKCQGSQGTESPGGYL